MARTSQARRKLMPYRYRRFGIDCDVTSYELDGEICDGPIERQRQLVDATRRTDWENICLNLDLHVPSEVLEAVFPEREHAAPPAALIVVVRCPDTYLRTGTTVATDAIEGNHIIGITISRSQLRNRATLQPYLVRTTEGQLTDGYADQPGNHLASPRHWEVVIDEDESAGGGYLDVSFDSFAERDHLRNAQVYHLETAGPEPTLYLNSNHQDVRAMLENEGNRGTSARLRDVAYDIIGSGVWTELFVSAAADVDENGDTPYNWQTGVLKFLLTKMYPDMDMESALSEVRTGIQENENAAAVFSRLNTVLQLEADTRTLQDHLAKLIQEVQ
jgi:hypothetical protein